jgi:hypothetical protein
MATTQRPITGANEDLRPKLGAVANVLAQSPIVAGAFGRVLGFVVMITTLTMIALVSITTVLMVSHTVAPIAKSAVGRALHP